MPHSQTDTVKDAPSSVNVIPVCRCGEEDWVRSDNSGLDCYVGGLFTSTQVCLLLSPLPTCK